MEFYRGYFPPTVISAIKISLLPCKKRLGSRICSPQATLMGRIRDYRATVESVWSSAADRRQLLGERYSLLLSQGSRSCLEHHREPSGPASFSWLQENRLQSLSRTWNLDALEIQVTHFAQISAFSPLTRTHILPPRTSPRRAPAIPHTTPEHRAYLAAGMALGNCPTVFSEMALL